jgi:hypothetical protein
MLEQKLRLRHVGRNPPRLVAGEQLGPLKSRLGQGDKNYGWRRNIRSRPSLMARRRAKPPSPLTLNPAFEPRLQPRPGFLVFGSAALPQICKKRYVQTKNPVFWFH